MKLPKLKCFRCLYSWIPRSDELPVLCENPKCRSPYWKKPKKRKGKSGAINK